ncbi:MAG: FtsX-like permease family protein [Candidatus Babeliales bacterium]
MFVPWLLAWRYITGAHHSTIRTMLYVCFFGIFVATTALALVMFIMEGFEQATHTALKGMHADIIIQARKNHHIHFPALQKVIHDEFPEITGCSPSDMHQGLVQSFQKKPLVVLIKGIDPQLEHSASSLASLTVQQQHALSQQLTGNKVILGCKLARQLRVTDGDSLDIMVPDDQAPEGATISLKKYTALVGDTFKTGIEEFDTTLLICSLSFLATLIPDSGCSLVSCHHTSNDEAKLIAQLKKRFNLAVYTWKDMYPSLVAALALEKYAMALILILMLFIASMSIVSLLYMIITSKQGDIALLQTIGLHPRHCRLIFIIVGMVVSIGAAFIGLLTALGIGIVANKYKLFKLPDAYYISYVPVIIHAKTVLVVLIIILALSLGATLLPLIRTQKISLSQLLRNVF